MEEGIETVEQCISASRGHARLLHAKAIGIGKRAYLQGLLKVKALRRKTMYRSLGMEVARPEVAAELERGSKESLVQDERPA